MDYDWDQAHEQIVAESFDTVTREEAIALVGILFTHRLVFSSELRARAVAAQRPEPIDLPPLELEPAASVVAFQSGYGVRELCLAASARWSDMKSSPIVERLKAAIESHRFVERLEPWPGLEGEI
jgi:hypothetical protein